MRRCISATARVMNMRIGTLEVSGIRCVYHRPLSKSSRCLRMDTEKWRLKLRTYLLPNPSAQQRILITTVYIQECGVMGWYLMMLLHVDCHILTVLIITYSI